MNNNQWLFSGDYPYKGYGGCLARCTLRVLLVGDAWVVVATEIPDNPGTSITNAVPKLAADVCKTFDLPHEAMVWIEHYPRDNRGYKHDTFDLVKMEYRGTKWSTPTWKRLQTDDIMQAISLAVEETKEDRTI